MQPTPLYPLHTAQAAKITDFAGFAMPLVYQSSVAECQAARRQAVLFDVSHMGHLEFSGHPSTLKDLEKLLPIDLDLLPPGKSRYSFLLNAQGGVVDDVIVSRLSETTLALVVNASRTAVDIAHIKSNFSADLIFTPREDLALLALQGPLAENLLAPWYPEIKNLFFMENLLLNDDVVIYRSGYSGEDGFEIRLPANQALALAKNLLKNPELQLAGLAARDVLRLEAGLCLYGQDLAEDISPIAADLLWAIPKRRRREGGFLGAKAVLQEIAQGSAQKRFGFLPQSKAPLRAGTPLRDANGQVLGKITSGSFSVTLQQPIAMGYLATGAPPLPTTLFADLRGQEVPCFIRQLPFVPPRYRLANAAQ